MHLMRETDIMQNLNFSHQIDSALRDERAFLFVAHNCLVVLQPRVIDDELWLNIMFAYSFGTTALPLHMDQIGKLAKQINAVGIELYTTVQKMKPFLIRKGFQSDNNVSTRQHWSKRFE